MRQPGCLFRFCLSCNTHIWVFAASSPRAPNPAPFSGPSTSAPAPAWAPGAPCPGYLSIHSITTFRPPASAPASDPSRGASLSLNTIEPCHSPAQSLSESRDACLSGVLAVSPELVALTRCSPKTPREPQLWNLFHMQLSLVDSTGVSSLGQASISLTFLPPVPGTHPSTHPPTHHLVVQQIVTR